MQIVLLLLFISQNYNIVKLDNREKHFIHIVKRDVHSSSIQNFHHYTKTYEVGDDIIFDPPNFTLIDSLLSSRVSTSSVREHTTWLMRQISLNDMEYTQIARYDAIKNRFIVNQSEDFLYTIDANNGQLTLVNDNNENLLYREINLRAESGLSQGDDIIYDIYRLIRLSTESINCTTNVTVNIDESIEITCAIEYKFVKYDHLNNYQPIINFTFYIKENNSIFTSIDQTQLNEIKDIEIDNTTLNWRRWISYKIRPINKKEKSREYACVIVPDTFRKEDLFQDKNRSCHIMINVRNDNSSTIRFSRLNKWDLIDILILVLIILSGILFLVSFVLCLAARKYNKKRIVQIKPEILDKTIALPLASKQLFSNKNENKANLPFITSKQFSESSMKSLSSQQIYRHKPGCPKYVPSSEYNLLSTDLFTHTTIDNIKKIILPDIPQSNDLFNDQTYIHFYIPSKNENLSIKKLP